jgi:hypothetical protein
MLEELKAPVVTAKLPFEAMELRALDAPITNPFAPSFLDMLYEKLLMDISRKFDREQWHQVETLLMLNKYTLYAKHTDFTGTDLLFLSEAVAEATHLVNWK